MRSARHEDSDSFLSPPRGPRPAAARAALRTPALACKRSAVRERERGEREEWHAEPSVVRDVVCDASSVMRRL